MRERVVTIYLTDGWGVDKMARQKFWNAMSIYLGIDSKTLGNCTWKMEKCCYQFSKMNELTNAIAYYSIFSQISAYTNNYPNWIHYYQKYPVHDMDSSLVWMNLSWPQPDRNTFGITWEPGLLFHHQDVTSKKTQKASRRTVKIFFKPN